MFTRRHEQELREIKALAYELAQSAREVLERISEARNEVASRGRLVEKREEVGEVAEAPPEGPREETAAEPTPASDPGRLNSASFDRFRELGMSITQAKRVIAYRDRHDGFDSVDDLDEIPGFPRAFLAELKAKLTP